YMGRGPKDVHVHLINDLVVCRLKGVLTAAEEHLVKTLPADKGRDLLKQVRSHLMETARPINGITFSLIAAQLLRDVILGRENADAALFSFQRHQEKL
ncbi:MAG: Na-translocating system protein MpsC family protein, partial [Tepidisphaeraceae bacterium]